MLSFALSGGYSTGSKYKRISGTPLDLALFLKQACGTNSQAQTLDLAISELLAVKNGHAKLPCDQIPHETVQVWRSLLFSESFSDCKFTFSSLPDEPPIYAHRNILSAASPYFFALFREGGPWSNGEGHVATVHSPAVLRCVLGFIYCGQLDEEKLEHDTAAVFAAGAEFQLHGLQVTVEERYCWLILLFHLTLSNIQ